MGEGGERCKEIEGADHKSNNNAMASAAMVSAEIGRGSDGGCHYQVCGTIEAVNSGGGDGGHCCQRRRSSLMVAMAVFVDGDGKGGCRQRRTRA